MMKDSMGSTVSLVTAMMNTSQVALSSFSSSFLLSTWDHDAAALIAQHCDCLPSTVLWQEAFQGEVHSPLMRLHQKLQGIEYT